MAWKDKPLGIRLDGSYIADLKALKKEGISFVILNFGMGYKDVNGDLSNMVQQAADADLPLFAEFIPMPAIDDVTMTSTPLEQQKIAIDPLKFRKIAGYIVRIDRWWTDYDIESKHQPIRTATGTAIDYTAIKIANMAQTYIQANKGPFKVFLATSDTFVQKYATPLAQHVDPWPFVLLDPRLRYKDPATGATVYQDFPAGALRVNTVADIIDQMPPDDAKNPLVPGNLTKMKMWQFAPATHFVHPKVTDRFGNAKAAEFYLWNGTLDDMTAFLPYAYQTLPGAGTTDPGTGDPGTGDPGTGDPGTGDPGTGTVVPGRLEAAITAFCKAWLEFKAE